MQDNAKPHTATKTINWLELNTPQFVEDWSETYPDLNPLENLWSIVDRKVHEKEILNTKALEKRIKTVIASLPAETVNNVINSMLQRVALCIAAKRGNFTLQ